MTIIAPPVNVAALRAALGPNASQRSPSINDDTTKGYAVGNFWRAPGGVIYQAQDITTGAAVWTPAAVSKKTLALDLVPGAVAAYGTTRLSSAYAGSALQVTRASDSTTKDIGFLPDGTLDVSTLDAFLTGTTGRVTTWYDQSGNVRNATQALATAPTITPLRTIGGQRTIMFDARPDAANSSNPSPAFTALTLPASVSIVPRTSTVAVVGGMQSAGRIAGFLNVGGSGASINLSSNYYATGTNLGNGGSAVLPAVGQPTDGGSLIMAVNSATLAQISIDDAVASSSAGTQIGSAATVTGGWIGGGWGGNVRTGFVDTGAVVIYNSTLSASDQAALKASLYAAFDLNPQARSTIVVLGDSHSDSFGSSLQQAWPRKMGALLNRPDVRVVNTGIYGEQVSLMLSRFNSDALPALSQANGAVWVILNGGWNDIASASASAATVYANIQSIAALVRNAGGKIAVSTSVLRSSSGANLATMQSLNSLIKAGWSGFADAFIDFAAVAPFGQTTTWAAPTFRPDAVHLTDQGYSLMAAIAAEKMRSLLA